jgi:hypothetical protein
MMVTKTGSQSTIKIEPSIQVSGTPLSGKMRFKCLDNRGYTSYSQDVAYNAHYNTVKYAIMRGCAALNEKIEVWTARGAFDYA